MGKGQRRLRREVPLAISSSAWVAARFDGRERLPGADLPLAHTSPVYVEVAGRPVFRPDAGKALRARIPCDQEILSSGMSTRAERSIALDWARRARRVLDARRAAATARP
jgi:hypothetical protein